MDRAKLFKLLVSLILPLSLGFTAGLLTAKAIPEWFATLNKPSFNPPGYLFGPVWTTLYLLMGVSMFLIWNTPKTELRQKALLVLAFNCFLTSGGASYFSPFTQFYFR